MTDEAGGAAPRRGFNYQDIAASYFFITEKPDFIDKCPLELHIEKFDSDFAYFIRYDDHDEEHFFEAKYRESGKFSIGDFYNILSDFSTIANEFADPDNVTFYHLVTNLSFGTKLNGLFKDAKKLRNSINAWSQIKEKRVYQQRNVNQLEDNTDLSDPELAVLFSRIYGHHLSKERMIQGIEDYVRKCNSPGNFSKPTQLILRTISQKDSGVIRREKLEKVSNASLRKRQESTKSPTGKSTAEIVDKLKGMANELSTPSVDTQSLHERKQETVEFTGRMLSKEDVPEEVAESQGTSLEEDLGRLIDLKEQEEQLKFGISQKTERFIDLADVTSTDNEEGGEDIEANNL